MIYVIDNGNEAGILLKEIPEKNRNLINHVSHSLHNPSVINIYESLTSSLQVFLFMSFRGLIRNMIELTVQTLTIDAACLCIELGPSRTAFVSSLEILSVDLSVAYVVGSPTK